MAANDLLLRIVDRVVESKECVWVHGSYPASLALARASRAALYWPYVASSQRGATSSLSSDIASCSGSYSANGFSADTSSRISASLATSASSLIGTQPRPLRQI